MTARTITLHIVSLRVFPASKPSWYVCTEKPFRFEPKRLDAPWIFGSDSEDSARSYASATVRAFRNNPHLRYEVAS